MKTQTHLQKNTYFDHLKFQDLTGKNPERNTSQVGKEFLPSLNDTAEMYCWLKGLPYQQYLTLTKRPLTEDQFNDVLRRLFEDWMEQHND